jgi:hypothetical protein
MSLYLSRCGPSTTVPHSIVRPRKESFHGRRPMVRVVTVRLLDICLFIPFAHETALFSRCHTKIKAVEKRFFKLGHITF